MKYFVLLLSCFYLLEYVNINIFYVNSNQYIGRNKIIGNNNVEEDECVVKAKPEKYNIVNFRMIKKIL